MHVLATEQIDYASNIQSTRTNKIQDNAAKEIISVCPLNLDCFYADNASNTRQGKA